MGANRYIPFGTFVVVLASGAPAHADPTPSDLARAGELFELGQQARLAGHHAEAREDFEKSFELDPGPGTMLNMAAEDEELGHMATAWRELRAGAEEARKTHPDWTQGAEIEAARILPTLPRLVLHLDGGGHGDDRRITLDGAPFPEPMLDTQMPVDAGPHLVEAAAPGKRAWSLPFEAKEATTSPVTVPVLLPDLAYPLPAPPQAIHAAATSNPRRTSEVVLGVVGAVSVAAATALAVSAYATYQASGCTDSCTATERSVQDRAWFQADVASVVGGAGALALAGAAALWLWDSGNPSRLEAKAWLGPTAVGVSIEKGW